MKAVARLVWSYFTCTPILRWFSIVGLVAILASFVSLTFLRQNEFALLFVTLGVGLFFFGSALMPLMFGRMARSHLIRVLPHGRIKLLVSAFVTVLIVSIPTPVLLLTGFLAAIPPPRVTPEMTEKYWYALVENAWLAFTTTFLTAGWLYLAMWFITSQRNIAGYVKALLVILVIMLVPARSVTELSITMKGSLLQIGATWLVFGTAFLLWPRWSAYRAARIRRTPGNFGAFLKRQISGREIDLLLGTSNPWLFAGAQLVPIVFASTIGFYSAAVWLFYLTIFSTVAGGIACQAAERSRALWLRGYWSREELFSQVERSFWRHNGFVLGVLIALMVGIGSYAALPVSLLAAGLPLLALGTVLSTYLGLMITRGLHLLESILAVSVMLALMAVAVIAARSEGETKDVITVVALEVLMAGLALILRAVAKKRWTRIDWMLCRVDRALVMRTAS